MRPYAGTTPSKAIIYAYSNLRRKPGIDASKPARYWPAMESPSKAGRAVCVRTLLSLSNAIVGWRSPDSSRNSASKQKSMLQQTESGRASAMVERISKVKRRDMAPAAIAAWHCTYPLGNLTRCPTVEPWATGYCLRRNRRPPALRWWSRGRRLKLSKISFIRSPENPESTPKNLRP